MTKIEENQGLGWDHIDKFNHLLNNDLPTDDLRVSAYKNTINTIDNQGYFVDKQLLFIGDRTETKYHDNVGSVINKENLYHNQVIVIDGDLFR